MLTTKSRMNVAYTAEAIFNKVGYNEVADIAKETFGHSKNPLCHHNFVRYSKVRQNIMPLTAKILYVTITLSDTAKSDRT